MTISPWTGDVEVSSPDNKKTAKVSNTCEIAMGAPTSGILYVNGKVISMRCNPSIVWSLDSQYLAFPEWTRSNNQRLMIYCIETGKLKKLFKTYNVLELAEYSESTIVGVDSPIHKPKKLSIRVKPF